MYTKIRRETAMDILKEASALSGQKGVEQAAKKKKLKCCIHPFIETVMVVPESHNNSKSSFVIRFEISGEFCACLSKIRKCRRRLTLSQSIPKENNNNNKHE